MEVGGGGGNFLEVHKWENNMLIGMSSPALIVFYFVLYIVPLVWTSQQLILEPSLEWLEMVVLGQIISCLRLRHYNLPSYLGP
jgi:hypothetical protein